MSLTVDEQNLVDEYTSKIKILKEYSLSLSEPIIYRGKIVNITPKFASNTDKIFTIDIPLAESNLSTVADKMVSPSVTTQMYTTPMLRITLQLHNDNIIWLLQNKETMNEMATAFFNAVRENYLMIKQLPEEISNYLGKTF